MLVLPAGVRISRSEIFSQFVAVNFIYITVFEGCPAKADQFSFVTVGILFFNVDQELSTKALKFVV